MKLYMIGVGGSIKGCNVEVHDMMFVIGTHLEGIYPELKRRWYGDSLHIDSICELEYIDGYKINLNVITNETLYMIVYGGYEKGRIDELHEYGFTLANSKEEAKNKAKEMMSLFKHMDHVDNIVDVFHDTGRKFGLMKGNFKLSDSRFTHTYIKLK